MTQHSPGLLPSKFWSFAETSCLPRLRFVPYAIFAVLAVLVVLVIRAVALVPPRQDKRRTVISPTQRRSMSLLQ